MWPNKEKGFPQEPTRWNLSDIAPWAFDGGVSEQAFADISSLPEDQQPEAFAQLFQSGVEPAVLKSPDALREAFEQKTQDLFGYLDRMADELEVQKQAPNGTALLDIIESHEVLKTEYSRICSFLSLYRKEFFKDAQAQAFCEDADESLQQVSHGMIELWNNVGFAPDTLESLFEEQPELEAYVQWLSPAPPLPEYKSISQQREEAEAADPRLADYRYLYTQVNSNASLDVGQRSEMITKMFNAKIYQEWEQAKEENRTVVGGYAQQNLLPEPFVQAYLEKLPELSKELAFEKQHEQTPIPPISWPEACDIVVTALEKFHPEMGEIARMALTEDWIHAAPDEVKFHNAFAMGSEKPSDHPAHHSYVLTNFDGTPSSLRTLGHEIGHAIVHYLESESQTVNGYLIQPTGKPAVEVGANGQHEWIRENARPGQPKGRLDTGVLHETFAHVTQSLTMDELLNRQTDPEIKAAMNEERLHDMRWAVSKFTPAFEHSLYKEVAKKGGPLTGTEIADNWRQHSGHINISDDDALAWAGKTTHYINYDPLCVMNYCFAEMGAQNVLANHAGKTGQDQQDYAEQWVNIMRRLPKGSQYAYGSAMETMDVGLDNIDAALKPVRARFEPGASRNAGTEEPPRPGFAERLHQSREASREAAGRQL